MTLQEIANAHGVCRATVAKWSHAKRQRAIIEAKAGVNQQVKRLLGTIAEQLYVFNCAADKRFGSFEAGCFRITNTDGRVLFSLNHININGSSAVVELQRVINTLEALNYGVQTVD
jgi:transposase-like protein